MTDIIGRRDITPEEIQRIKYHPETNTDNLLYLPLQHFDMGIASPIISKDINRRSCAVTGTTWSPLGRAMDGDDLINLDNALPSFASTTVGTWIAWLKVPDTTPVADSSIISFSDTPTVEIIYLHLHADGYIEGTCYDAGALQWNLRTTSTTLLTNDIFAHLALVQDGTSPVLYVNGVVPAQSFTNSTNKTKWFADCALIDNGRIGVNHVNAGDSAWLTGTVGSVTLYDTNLTALQIQNDYLATKEYYGL